MKTKYAVSSILCSSGRRYSLFDIVEVDEHMFLKVYPYCNPGAPCTLVKFEDIDKMLRMEGFILNHVNWKPCDSELKNYIDEGPSIEPYTYYDVPIKTFKMTTR